MATGAWAVVVAAGEGRRFGAAKQFLELGGRPVLEWAVEAARAATDEVVLVVPPDAVADPALHAGCRLVAAGGPTRAASVRAGLELVPAGVEVVVVHDAARPLATPALFDAVIGGLGEGIDGVVPGVGLSDTVKRVAAGRVAETLPRDELVAVQTPQAFRTAALRAAHRSGAEATDDAALLERCGALVAVVPGEEANVKLTSRADLVLLERLLAQRHEVAGA